MSLFLYVQIEHQSKAFNKTDKNLMATTTHNFFPVKNQSSESVMQEHEKCGPSLSVAIILKQMASLTPDGLTFVLWQCYLCHRVLNCTKG